jgi:hypothetical protein
MDYKNKDSKAGFYTILWCTLVILLCSAPCSALFISSGETVNIGYSYTVQHVDYPVVMGTLNLHPGAEVYSGIMALSGSTINFYGGQMSAGSYTIAFSSVTNPEITVHGRNFAVNGQPLDPSATSFTLALGTYEVLTGFYDKGDPINLTFYGNIPINLATSVQEVAINIKPGSYPNPLNIKDKGVLPVAVLGSEDFDVFNIDPASIRLEGVAPIRSSYEDVATPVNNDAEVCECTTEGPDGYLDLTLKFKTQEIIAALGEVNDGDLLELILTGALTEVVDGTPIEGSDCVVIIAKDGKEK